MIEDTVSYNYYLIYICIVRVILQHADMQLVLTQNIPCDCESGAMRGKCCLQEDGGRQKDLHRHTDLHAPPAEDSQSRRFTCT